MFKFTFKTIPFTNEPVKDEFSEQLLGVKIEIFGQSKLIKTDIVVSDKALKIRKQYEIMPGNYYKYPVEAARAFLLSLLKSMLEESSFKIYQNRKHYKITDQDVIIHESVNEVKYIANYLLSMPDTLIDDLMQYIHHFWEIRYRLDKEKDFNAILSLIKVLFLYSENYNQILDYHNIHGHINRIEKYGIHQGLSESQMEELFDILREIMEYSIDKREITLDGFKQ